jgi:hypothetical protein
VILPTDLAPASEDLARRIIVLARSIAPCLDTLEDEVGDETPKPKSEAIAILKGVAADVRMRGVKAQRSGSSSVEYIVNGSSFSADDRASLRSLCTTSTAGLPLGSFPNPSPAVMRLFPEEC